MKNTILTFIAIILILCGLFLLYKRPKINSNIVISYGNIEIRQINLGFQTQGQVQQMLKKEGDAVQKGELVAILDNKDFIANSEKIKLDIEKAESNLKKASDEYDKNAELCASNNALQADCVKLAENKEKAELTLKNAVESKKLTQNDAIFTKLYAPESGVITTKFVEVGAVVLKGQSVYTLTKQKPLWVKTYVPKKNMKNVAYGMKALVVANQKDEKTGKNRTYEGRIGYISQISEFTPKTAQSTASQPNIVYEIRVYIDNPDKFLHQDMPVTITINMMQ